MNSILESFPRLEIKGSNWLSKPLAAKVATYNAQVDSRNHLAEQALEIGAEIARNSGVRPSVKYSELTAQHEPLPQFDITIASARGRVERQIAFDALLSKVAEASLDLKTAREPISAELDREAAHGAAEAEKRYGSVRATALASLAKILPAEVAENVASQAFTVKAAGEGFTPFYGVAQIDSYYAALTSRGAAHVVPDPVFNPAGLFRDAPLMHAINNICRASEEWLVRRLEKRAA